MSRLSKNGQSIQTTSKNARKMPSISRPFHAENSYILVCKTDEHLNWCLFLLLEQSKLKNSFEIEYFCVWNRFQICCIFLCCMLSIERDGILTPFWPPCGSEFLFRIGEWAWLMDIPLFFHRCCGQKNCLFYPTFPPCFYSGFFLPRSYLKRKKDKNLSISTKFVKTAKKWGAFYQYPI